ncbi:hypothetical protein GQ53DRAFT_857576 [Thozetella sp. PMI_491]|nr:hypothetical protein GQ53DRAFT_857576 [Thozetella sp. PMI_491]
MASIEDAKSVFVSKGARGDRTRLSSTWWALELSAMAVSWGCMAAVVLLLLRIQNTDSTAWTFPIGFNALIAMFTTISRVALLMSVSAGLSQEKWLYFKKQYRPLHDLSIFDSASRGPHGAIALLLSVRWGFATLGSVVVLLAFVKDAFIQQVVQFETDNNIFVNDGLAVFPSVRNFDSGTASPSTFENGSLPKDGATTDVMMQGAIFRGLYQDSWTPPFNCSSKCVWEGDYTLLGFSSTCQNVTQLTVATKSCSDTPNDYATKTEGYSINQTDCTMTTPGGVTIITEFLPQIYNSYSIINATSLLEFPNYGDPDTDQPLFQDPELVRVALWNSTRAYPGAAYFLEESITGEIIMECSLSLSAFQYTDLNADSGRLSYHAKPVSLGQVSGTYNRTISDGTSKGIVFGYYFNDSGNPFYVNKNDLSGLANFFTSPTFSGQFFDSVNGSSSGIGMTKAFSNKDPSTIFTNVAQSMTNQLQQGKGGQSLAYGLTNKPIVFIRVQWLWLLLPLTVQSGGFVFLIAVIFKSRRESRVPLWKASPTALLLHTVKKDGTIAARFSGPEELRRSTERLMVKLE